MKASRRPPGYSRRGAPLGQCRARGYRLGIPGGVLSMLEILARRLYRRRENQRAAILAEQILRFDPTRYRPRLLLGDLAMRNNEWRAAFINFRRACRHNPASSISWCRLGEAAFQLGDHLAAQRFFERAISLEASAPGKATARARVYLTQCPQVFGHEPMRGQNLSGEMEPTRELSEADFAGYRPAGKPPRSGASR